MATGRRLQYMWADRAGGGGEPQSLPLPGLLPDRQETEVPRGCRDLPKVTPASGREPRSGCCHHGLRRWVPSNLGSGKPSCCEHLVTNHFLIVFSSSWMISLGSIPRSGRPGSPGRRGAVALPSGGCSEQSQFAVSPKTGSPVRPGQPWGLRLSANLGESLQPLGTSVSSSIHPGGAQRVEGFEAPPGLSCLHMLEPSPRGHGDSGHDGEGAGPTGEPWKPTAGWAFLPAP